MKKRITWTRKLHYTFYTCCSLHIFPNAQVTSKKMVHKKRPFSGTVFHTLSHDVFHFVASGSFKNHWIEASDWLSKNLNQSEGGFLSYHSQQNWPHHVKGYWKLCQKLVSFCEPFCFRSIKRFERCVISGFEGKLAIIFVAAYAIMYLCINVK